MPSTHPFIHPSIHLPIHPFVHLPTHPPIQDCDKANSSHKQQQGALYSLHGCIERQYILLSFTFLWQQWTWLSLVCIARVGKHFSAVCVNLRNPPTHPSIHPSNQPFLSTESQATTSFNNNIWNYDIASSSSPAPFHWLRWLKLHTPAIHSHTHPGHYDKPHAVQCCHKRSQHPTRTTM